MTVCTNNLEEHIALKHSSTDKRRITKSPFKGQRRTTKSPLHGNGRKNNKSPFQDHRQRKDTSKLVPRKSLLSFLQGIN
jgi:hypothetical protein